MFILSITLSNRQFPFARFLTPAWMLIPWAAALATALVMISVPPLVGPGKTTVGTVAMALKTEN